MFSPDERDDTDLCDVLLQQFPHFREQLFLAHGQRFRRRHGRRFRRELLFLQQGVLPAGRQPLAVPRARALVSRRVLFGEYRSPPGRARVAHARPDQDRSPVISPRSKLKLPMTPQRSCDNG